MKRGEIEKREMRERDEREKREKREKRERGVSIRCYKHTGTGEQLVSRDTSPTRG